jgi:acyl-CoA synthetase (AMP-forming)/AMP-acid ligase II
LTDTITYFLTWLGLARAGYTVFHISPRNSPAAVAHLLTSKSVVHVLTSCEPGIKAVVTAALAEMDVDENRRHHFVSDMPSFDSIMLEEDPTFLLLPPRDYDQDSVVCYIHSSGESVLARTSFQRG